MYITERRTGNKHTVVVEPVVLEDYRYITKKRFFFDWKTERNYQVYKLRRSVNDVILGLMSLEIIDSDKRIEIKLLAVSIENRSSSKKEYDRIAGTLIGFACREAIKHYGVEACVSLLPKTDLKDYYIAKYGMIDAGKQIFLEGLPLLRILNNYNQ
jgi:dUTPase